MSILITNKRVFNPKIDEDRKIAERYVESSLKGNASWGKKGCPFKPSGSNISVDAEIRNSLLAHYIRTNRSKRSKNKE